MQAKFDRHGCDNGNISGDGVGKNGDGPIRHFGSRAMGQWSLEEDVDC